MIRNDQSIIKYDNNIMCHTFYLYNGMIYMTIYIIEKFIIFYKLA